MSKSRFNEFPGHYYFHRERERERERERQTDRQSPKSSREGGGRVVRWCWVNFQCRGVPLIWIIVWQGPTALAVGAGWGCLDIFFSRLSFLFSFSLSGRWADID